MTFWNAYEQKAKANQCIFSRATCRMGSSAYDSETVGKPAKQVFSHLVKLGARPLVTAKSFTKRVEGKKSKSLMIGDSEVGDADVVFHKWLNGITGALEEGESIVIKAKKKYSTTSKKESSECACKESGDEAVAAENECCSNKSDKGESSGCCSDTKEKDGDNHSSSDSLSDDDDEEGSDIVDLEDMGGIMNEQNLQLKSAEPKEMVTKKQAKVSQLLLLVYCLHHLHSNSFMLIHNLLGS